MEQVGTQVKLPLNRALQIAVQGIRIRLGRSLVTVSGVVLGIAFLMSNLTGQLIKSSVTHERELRQTVNLMMSLVQSEVGTVKDKSVSIAAVGTRLTEAEAALVRQIIASSPAAVRGAGFPIAGVAKTDWKTLGTGSALLLVLGDGRQCSTSLSDLTAGMTQKIILDSLGERTYAGTADPSVRRELFFGAQIEQQIEKLRRQTEQEKARMIWIVAISLLVTVIGVANALLMSVTERFREIGTMKCLGALSRFIRTLFLIESSLIGFAGSVIGSLLGALLPMIAYGFTYRFTLVFGSMPYPLLLLTGLASVIVGTLLAMVAAIYPAHFASRMVPADALRSTV